MRKKFAPGTDGLRLTVMFLLLAGCGAATYWCHFRLRTELAFTHLFYVPIVLAGIWFGKRAVSVALLLGAMVFVSQMLSDLKPIGVEDLFRALMFVVVAQVVGTIWENYQQSREALKGTRDFLSDLIDSSSTPILVWNEHGRISMFNRAFMALTGCEEEELRDRPVDELMDSVTFAGIKAKLENDCLEPFEATVTCKRGKDTICLWSPSCVYTENGISLRAIMLQGQDITKRKSAEDVIKKHAAELSMLNQRLADSEKNLRELNAAKDKFFSIISHDLRSPFTPLLMYAELMWREAETMPREQIKESALALHRNAKRLFGLLENLLEWARLQTGTMECHPELLDLKEAVRRSVRVLREVAEAKEVLLSDEVPENLTIWADTYHVGCMLQNLLSNGIKFSNPGDRVSVSAREENGRAVITVKDTGVGMKPEALEAIFRIDTYHTTLGTADEKGSGLGLVLTKELVAKNGGTLAVESAEGKGSTFTVTLPARRESKAEGPERARRT